MPKKIEAAEEVESRVIGGRVPLSLAKKIDELAERTGRSHSAIVKDALSAFLARQRGRGALPTKPFIDANGNRLVDYPGVKALVERLGVEERSAASG